MRRGSWQGRGRTPSLSAAWTAWRGDLGGAFTPWSSGVSVNARRGSVVVVAAGALFGLVLGVLQLGWHFRLFFARAGFPLDLEWMEGGMLLHASRFAEGKTIYVAPSLDFIPYLYTPLYPALLAALSKL